MGRKVFLSFLGTGPYTECNYYEENNNHIKVNNVNFIQKALIKLYCNDFNEEDKIYIFLTEGENGARFKNWNNNGNFKIGLKDRLTKLNLKSEVIEVSYNESKIWDMFNKMYEVLEDEDEVIFDVTHSFRYIPMLAMVMFNYAKFLKNIKLKAIHYGAFERLGHPKDVKKIPLEDRNAPIIDLTAFDELQQWSVGADNFVNYGNADKIVSLIKNESVLRFISQNDGAGTLKGLQSKLNDVLEIFSTIRGLDIISGKKVLELKSYLEDVKGKGLEFKAIKPILEKIEKTIFEYKKDSLNNLVLTIDFYLKNNQIQQAITLIQETIITYILAKNDMCYDVVSTRNLVSSLIHIKSSKILEEEWSKDLTDNLNVTNMLLKDKLLNDVYKNFSSLINYRNSINHGGFILHDYIESNKFGKQVKKVWKEVRGKLQNVL